MIISPRYLRVLSYLFVGYTTSGLLNSADRRTRINTLHRQAFRRINFLHRRQHALFMSTRQQGQNKNKANILTNLLAILIINLSATLPLPAYAAELIQNDRNINIQHDTVLDEVWTLCNKYYLDQTFNHHNWNKVRSYYEEQLPINVQSSDGKLVYDDEKAMKLASAMMATLNDKYSRILDKESYARIQKYDLIGVGATLMPENDDTLEGKNSIALSSTEETAPTDTTLTQEQSSNPPSKKIRRIIVGAPPVPGSSADKAGIHVGDIITAVNGVKTAGRTAFDIIDQISQDPNADTITMTVMSPYSSIKDTIKTSSDATIIEESTKNQKYNIRDVTMERQTAKITNPVSYLISERRKDGTNVGYIKISEFNSLVKPRLQDALTQLEKDGANAYVLDLRSNPGGAFQSAVEISGLFMNNKLATKVIDANKVELPFRTPNDNTIVDPNHPIVIWVDGGSASASEVLAGALHDQCRAVVAGSTNSFGKGLIQAVYGLKNGYGLVLTVARYVTPSGYEIQGNGIAPDMRVSLPIFSIPGTPFTSDINFKEAVEKMSPPLCQAPG